LTIGADHTGGGGRNQCVRASRHAPSRHLTARALGLQ